MGCGSGGCSTGGCGGGCSSGGCNKLNTYDWLVDMDLPAYMKPFGIIEVHFKGTRKDYYENVGNHDITLKDIVVVESDNGYDIGKVSLKGELVKLQLKKAGITDYENHPFPKIIRRANEADEAKYKENKELEVPTMYRARSIAMELGLQMKLSDVEYRGDRRKATFFYTAEERVDFRELIKRLADAFKVRIEMRQIGYRQEAARLGAIGSCGRELCCSTWLTDFKLVHTNAARYQNLSLNPLKLSGQCGKLKCCLNFELDAYMEAWKDFPTEENLTLEFSNGPYRLVKTDILKRTMWFAPTQEFGGEWIHFHTNRVKEIIDENKQGIKPELVVPKKELVIKELDFQNDMGVDDINRLDNRRSKNKNKRNRDKDRNQNRGGEQRNRSNNPQPNQQTKQQQPQSANPPSDQANTGNAANQPRNNNNNNRRRNNNNNRNRGNRNPNNNNNNPNKA